MNTVQIRNLTLGIGAPKTIVSLMGKTAAEVLENARVCATLPCDIIEWRADYLDQASTDELIALAHELRALLPQPLLFTYRSGDEGGATPLKTKDCFPINLAIPPAVGNAIDMIDIQMKLGARLARRVIDSAHRNDIKVIVSYHDFEKTPPKREILHRLQMMQNMGADITKIAVMPHTPHDVLTLLSASLKMRTTLADRPFITIAMGKMGVISRLAADTFGSCATFAAAGAASAPGQVSLALMNQLRHEG